MFLSVGLCNVKIFGAVFLFHPSRSYSFLLVWSWSPALDKCYKNQKESYVGVRSRLNVCFLCMCFCVWKSYTAGNRFHICVYFSRPMQCTWLCSKPQAKILIRLIKAEFVLHTLLDFPDIVYRLTSPFCHCGVCVMHCEKGLNEIKCVCVCRCEI